MSTDVTSTGFMAQLITPITSPEAREDLTELYYDEGIDLSINYEGTIIFSSGSGEMNYGLVFLETNQSDKESFLALTRAQNHPVIVSSVRQYTCTWYNGSDSPMDMLTLEEFINS